jgi:hypothetical protein
MREEEGHYQAIRYAPVPPVLQGDSLPAGLQEILIGGNRRKLNVA